MINITKKQYIDWINSKTENFKYYTPAPYINQEKDPETGQLIDNRKQFPILAMGERTESKSNIPYSILEFENVKEAGFNVLLGGWLYESDEVLGQSLKNAIISKIKLLFKNWAFQEGVKYYWDYNDLMGIVKDPDNIDGFGGNDTLRDEPTFKDIIGEDATGDDGSLKEDSLWSEYYHMMKLDPDYLVYINLVAGGDRLKGAEGKDEDEKFEDYLKKFQYYFKPSLFSYDLYPISEVANLLYEGLPDPNGELTKQDSEGKIIVGYDGFYKRLETVRNISKETKRPFYAFCLGISFMLLNSHHYSGSLLEQYLRYEAFTALAYGAKGIVYWRFATPPNSDDESYFSALLNRNNDKTATWHYAQKVNNEIHKYQDVFLDTTLYSIDRTYDNSSSAYINIPISSHYYSLSIISTEPNNFIASRFIDTPIIETSNKTFLVVVNTSPLKYTSFNLLITRGFVIERTPLNSTSEPNMQPLSTMMTIRRILPPGGYRIFELL